MASFEFNPKPYMLRGKMHSIRTLHTALNKVSKRDRTSLGFEAGYAVLHDLSTGEELRYPRSFVNGHSVIDA